MLDLGELFVKNMNIFRKVCEVMSNRGKKLAFTTATIAAIATVGSNVNAEEVTTPVAPSEPVAEATTETKTTTVSDEQVLDAQDKVSDAKADKQAKETALTEAEAKRDAKAEEKAAAQAEEKALTEKVEAAKEATPEKVADLERTANEKTADKEAKSQTLNNAKADQTAKQADVENKTNALEAAKAEQTAAADKVKAAEDALSDTAVKSAQDAKDAADKKVNDATAAKNAADKELADSKKADQTRADSIASQKTIVAQDTTNKNNAIETEKAKTAEKERLANDLTVAKKSLADNLEIPVTNAYISALKAYKQKDSKANNDALLKIAKEILTSKEVEAAKELLKESDTRAVDPTNLTTEQLKELNIRMAQFVEDVRTKFGTFSPTMVRVSEESVNLSKLIGETYKNAVRKHANTTNPTVWDAAGMGHLKSDVSVGANMAKAGYKTTASPVRMETLAFSLDTNMTTMGELKAELYNSMIRWMYDDDLSDWGHALIQSGLARDYKKTELHTFVVQDGEYVTIGATETLFKTLDSELKTKEYDIPSTDYDKTVTRVTTLEKQIETNKTELAQAIKNVKTTTAKLEDSTNELKRLEAVKILTPAKQAEADKAAKALEDAKATQAAANKRLQDVSADNATKLAALNQARADKATADSNVTAKEQDLATATAALEAAKQTTATREKELENAVQAEKEAKKAVEDAKELLANKTKLEADLAAKKAEVQKHCDDLKALENDVTAKAAAKTAAETALADAEKEYNRLLAIYTAERMVEPLIQDELPEFVGGVNYGEDLVFELPELMIPEETPTVSNVASAGNTNETLGQAVHNEGPGAVVNEDQLPNTGTGSEFAIFSAAALSILASLGLVVTSRKKEQE